MAKRKVASTQEHLPIAEVRDGFVILKNGSLRAVLLVSAVNFALKSEEEQNALVFQYQNFLNSLSFPIQIVVQSRHLDIQPYLARLSERLNVESNELLRMQIADYIDFVKKLLSVANVMDKNFFVVIPFEPAPVSKAGFMRIVGSRAKKITIAPEQFTAYKQQLAERVNVITSGLASMGLRSASLSTQQLVELFYASYNPQEATRERLTKLEFLSSPIIERQPAMPQAINGKL
jgi:type IV secretory pathway VirB4 component